MISRQYIRVPFVEQLTQMTMIYTAQQTQQLADEMVEREEKAAGKELTEEEKERLWNLIKSSVEGG